MLGLMVYKMNGIYMHALRRQSSVVYICVTVTQIWFVHVHSWIHQYHGIVSFFTL